jgi:CRP-like cAMP-binding protein
VLELAHVFGDAPPIAIPLIQEDIAALAGTSRATVNRVLREAERRGIVELRRGRTVVLDADALARLAQLRDRIPADRP